MSANTETASINPPTQGQGYDWTQATPKLNAAFAKARAEFPPIPKNRTSKVMKDGRLLYEFHYADLADILTATAPALSKYGLAIYDSVIETDDGRLRLWTVLSHDSGEMRKSVVPLMPNTNPQQWGGFLTYMRRYSAGAILGIASEEDDDGNRAAGNEHETTERARKPAGKPPTQPKGADAKTQGKPEEPPPGAGTDPATTTDIKALFATAKSKKWTEQTLKDVMTQLYKKDSTKKLTRNEAADLRALVGKFDPDQFAKAFTEGQIQQDPDGRWGA